MSTFTDRLRIAFNAANTPEKRISKSDLARACGIAPSSVTDWFSGSSKSMKPENLVAVSTALGVRVRWLAGGEGPMKADIHQLKRKAEAMRVPIVGNTQAGPDTEWLELGYPAGWGDEYFELLCPDPNAYGLIVRGDSMYPRYREGEAICVAPNIAAQPGDDVIVKCNTGEVMLKEFSAQHGKRYVFESRNTDHPTIVRDEAEIVWMHLVYARLPITALRQS